MSAKETLAAVHPLFRAAPTRVLSFEPVVKLNQAGGTQHDLLAIATPGLFLIKKRTFPKSYILSRTIPFPELNLVRIQGSDLTLASEKTNFVVQHSQNIQLAQLIVSMHKALFRDVLGRLKLEISDPSVLKQVDQGEPFKSESEWGDRFLGFTVGLPPAILLPDAIATAYAKAKPGDSVFQFDSDLISSPLIKPIALAVACDAKLTSLILTGVTFSQFLTDFIPIVRHNSALRTITFSKTIFKGEFKPFADAVSQKAAFAVNQYIFSDCDLGPSDFIVFLESFMRYPADLSSLSFISCRLTPRLLERFVELLPSAASFRALAHLTISGATCDGLQNALLNLCSRSATSQLQCLAQVDFTGCNLDVDEVLPVILSSRSPLTSVILSNNSLKSVSKLKAVTSFATITDVSLSNCEMNAASLLALFGVFEKASPSPIRLILDSLKLPDWPKFYAGLSSVSTPLVETLSWCGNAMSPSDLGVFRDFVLAQPNLSFLGLSGSFAAADAESALAEIGNLAKAKPLTGLELQAVGAPLADKLIPLLKSLLETGHITVLDITGQAVGDAGLELVALLAEKCLRDLRCDGSKPSRYEKMINVVSRLAVSPLNACEWPAKDIALVTEALPPNVARPILAQLQVLKEQFNQKLNPEHGVKQAPVSADAEQQAPGRRIHRWSRLSSVVSRGTVAQLDRQLLTLRDENTKAALDALFGEGQLKEAVVDLMTALEKKISLDTFVARGSV
jgi:hypothetical protein